MSFNIRRIVREKVNKKKLKSDNGLHYINQLDLNKSSPFFNEKYLSENDSPIVSTRKENKRFVTNKVKNGKTMLDNYTKSSSFLDRNKDTVIGTIRDSDIGFEILNFDYKNIKQENFDCESPKRTIAEKKWGVIYNVFKVINNMKNVNTKSLKSINDLDKSLTFYNNNRKKLRKNNPCDFYRNYHNDSMDCFKENYEEITKQIILFEFVAGGLDENIEEIIKIVKDDPSRNMYDLNKKHHYFINKKNYEGFTVLYVACINGHLKIVDVLFKNYADHLIKCGSGKEEESVLEVAIRWGHIKLLEVLLKLIWPSEYLMAGLKLAISGGHENLIKVMKKAVAENRIKHKKSYSCCFG